MTQSAVSRSPLRYRFVRAAACLVPHWLVGDPDRCIKWMELLLEELFRKKRITAFISDKVLRQFKQFVESVNSCSDMKNSCLRYSIKNDSLDAFYATLLQDHTEYHELWATVKLVLILSHGNAHVESGFSINKQLVRENLKATSLVSLRQVYDAVTAAGGISKFTVDQDMIKGVKGARSRYDAALQEQKTLTAKNQQDKRMERKRKASEIRKLQEKKETIMDEVQAISAKIKDLEQ